MRNDPARLAELRRLMILDTGPETAFEDIARLLATALAVPITMVSLLDAERDWFKACVGSPLRESPAATSFCESFFRSDEALIVVEDTLLDERFREHPLVLGAPHVRFYAAARLVTNGQTVGTLCAYDLQPRRLEPAQRNELRTLMQAVVGLLGQRAAGSIAGSPGSR